MTPGWGGQQRHSTISGSEAGQTCRERWIDEDRILGDATMTIIYHLVSDLLINTHASDRPVTLFPHSKSASAFLSSGTPIM